MIEINEDDSDEDVFILKQIKPVSRITRAQALKIKDKLVGDTKSDDGEIAIIDEIDKNTKCSVSPKTNNNDKSKIINGNSADNQITNKTPSVEVAKDNRLEAKKKSVSTPVSRKKRKSSSPSPGRSIKDYFTPTKNSPNGTKSSGEKNNSSPGSSSKKIKLSPSILKRAKKFKLDLDKVNNSPSKTNGKSKTPSPKKSSKKSPEAQVIKVPSISKIFSNEGQKISEAQDTKSVPSTSRITPNEVHKKITEAQEDEAKENITSENNLNLKNVTDSNLINPVPSTSKSPPNKLKQKTSPKRLSDATTSKYPNENSKLNCELFKQLIHDEMKKQLLLETKSGPDFERLLTMDELDIIDKFFKLDIRAQQLFVRMYARQHKENWYRLSNIKYEDISSDLTSVYDTLKNSEFFETKVEEIELVEQLKLLKKNEVQLLCKGFNLNLSTLSTAKKEVLIERLIEDNKKQKSVWDMMCKSKTASRLELLKAEIKKALGACFKLNERVVEIFNRIVLLYSLVYYYDDESNRIGDTLYFLFKIRVGQLKYLNYEVEPTVIFRTRKDFLRYEKALQLRQKMEIAVQGKNFESFDAVAKEARREFQELFKDEEYLARFKELKPFLKRFSAGSVYSSILTAYCDKFKTKTEKKEIVEIGCLLLDQNYFGLSKKGHWYELTTQAYEASRCTELAGKLLIVAFKDEFINAVMKLTLQLRGKALLKRKTHGIVDTELKNYLELECTTRVPEPLTREISARALEGCAGFKSVYVMENQSGTSYSSVEEQALYHYKREDGFEQGLHVEGMLIHTIYFLLFFDIIYGKSPPGVFQSPYQETPLDFASSSFYTSREIAIESRLEEMNFWTFEDILAKISLVYYENFNTTCCVSWKEEFTPELFCDIIKCIGIEPLKAICKRLVSNYRVFRSGFPDLTLWNTKTQKVKFVEVKSPNDRLSPNQRIWLDFLKRIGLECEVCNVKNVGGKKFRS